MYPGQFPNIKLNLFNVVIVLDLSQTSALKLITGSISGIINRSFPIRFGVVPITETEEGDHCRLDNP
jgi:UDP-glucose:glycoprotein glucosyltransferase